MVLNFDPDDRSLSLGAEKGHAETDRIEESILAYIAGCNEPQTRVQIEDHVEGKTTHLRKGLKSLRADRPAQVGVIVEIESENIRSAHFGK
jgi:hypothetical protein